MDQVVKFARHLSYHLLGTWTYKLNSSLVPHGMFIVLAFLAISGYAHGITMTIQKSHIC